jgi:hypothetical protein
MSHVDEFLLRASAVNDSEGPTTVFATGSHTPCLTPNKRSRAPSYGSKTALPDAVALSCCSFLSDFDGAVHEPGVTALENDACGIPHENDLA